MFQPFYFHVGLSSIIFVSGEVVFAEIAKTELLIPFPARNYAIKGGNPRVSKGVRKCAVPKMDAQASVLVNDNFANAHFLTEKSIKRFPDSNNVLKSPTNAQPTLLDFTPQRFLIPRLPTLNQASKQASNIN